MRTAAWETAPQRTLRDCSKEAVGKIQDVRFWLRGSSEQSSTHFTTGFLLVTKGFSDFLDMKGCKDWDEEISS